MHFGLSLIYDMDTERNIVILILQFVIRSRAETPFHPKMIIHEKKECSIDISAT